MEVIIPKLVTSDGTSDSTLISSSLPASVLDEWAEDKEYSVNDEIIYYPQYGLDKKIPIVYQSLSNENTENQPDTSITDWLSLGASNRWKMFDSMSTSLSESTNTISVSISATDVDTLILLNVTAQQVSISHNLGSEVITPNSTIDIIHKIGDAGDYTANIDIIPSSIASIGHCFLGKSYYLGSSQFGASTTIKDFSRIETNEDFGYTYLKQGAYRKEMDIDLMLMNDQVNDVWSKLISLRAMPAVWQGNQNDTDFNNLIIYGYFSSFSVLLKEHLYSDCSLSIKGLI